MSPLRHARRLADWFAASAGGPFTREDVWVEPGRARLFHAVSYEDRTPDGLLRASLVARALADVTALAAGSLVLDRGVVAHRLVVETLSLRVPGAGAGHAGLLLASAFAAYATSVAGDDTPAPSAEAIAAHGTLEADGGGVVARMEALYVPSEHPLVGPGGWPLADASFGVAPCGGRSDVTAHLAGSLRPHDRN